MSMLLKLAWRNIWRNWRRSIITILAVFFATFLSLVMRSMQLGSYDQNIKVAVEMFTGYLQVQKEGFMENPSLRKSFILDDELKSKIGGVKGVEAFTPRIMADGLIGNDETSIGAAIMALDPRSETSVSNLKDKMKEGEFLRSDSLYRIVVGYKMLQNLNAEIGDELVILSNGYDGTMGNMKFRIGGTFRIGQTEFDAMSILMHIDAAKELLAMGDRVTSVAIKMNDVKDIPIVRQGLEGSIKNPGLVFLDWEELMPDLKQSIEFDNASGIIYLGLLVIIVAFAILNTVLMSITERFREFGIMLALGTRQVKLVVMVLFEVIFISFIGVLLGNIIGYLVSYYGYLNPIYFTGEYAEISEAYGWVPAMYFSVDPSIFVVTSVSIMIIAVVAYLYPAYRLKNLEAMKGIRYT